MLRVPCAERRALRHADTSQALLERAARRYRLEATSIQTLLRLVFVCTASGAIAQSELEHEGRLGGGGLLGLQRVNVALPLVMSFLITLYSTSMEFDDLVSLCQSTSEAQELVQQFSVFSNLFLLAQLNKVINAPTLDEMREGKEILANEIGVVFRPKSKRRQDAHGA